MGATSIGDRCSMPEYGNARLPEVSRLEWAQLTVMIVFLWDTLLLVLLPMVVDSDSCPEKSGSICAINRTCDHGSWKRRRRKNWTLQIAGQATRPGTRLGLRSNERPAAAEPCGNTTHSGLCARRRPVLLDRVSFAGPSADRNCRAPRTASRTGGDARPWAMPS